MVQEWWDSFVDEYLLELNGAVNHLGILEERSQKILENSPVIDVRQGMFYPDMRQSCEQWLAGEIRQAPRKIIAEGLAPEKENMKRFRQKKKELDDVFQSMEQAVSNQEKDWDRQNFFLTPAEDLWQMHRKKPDDGWKNIIIIIPMK